MIRVRFAFSPFGTLFIGGLRLALANDLFARRGKGEMLLRLDDLDKDRGRAGTGSADQVDPILQDLRWFGLDWADTFRQSGRLDLYQATIERLKRDKLIYPCFESEEELKAKAEFRRKRRQPLTYDRAMLSLTEKQRADAEAGGKRPHWRFKLSGRTLEWNDLVLGPRRGSLTGVSDPIVVRADGTPAPALASVIDDIDRGITHVIRGEDNVGNTAVQLELFEVLRGGQAGIRFAQLPALTDSGAPNPGGRKVSNLSVRALRQDGVDPRAIAACLFHDASEPDEMWPAEALVRQFGLKDLAPSGFSVSAMLAANRRILAHLDFATVADRLPEGATEAFWLAVRGNLDLLKEARGWWEVIAGTIIPPVIDGAHVLMQTAEALLPPEPWDNTVWTTWIALLEQETALSGEALVAPLRLALTGEDDGPDLADLLPLIGRPQAVNRLSIAAA